MRASRTVEAGEVTNVAVLAIWFGPGGAGEDCIGRVTKVQVRCGRHGPVRRGLASSDAVGVAGKMKQQLEEKQIRMISAESFVDERTVRRFADGEVVRPSSEHRIREAAKKLRIKLR